MHLSYSKKNSMNTALNTKDTKKIEAIYPLSTMQQGILFHHLSATEDQGFLIVQCTIDGALNTTLFKNAWALATKRHAVLRTSVHWETVKTPVQIVKPEGSLNCSIEDWSHRDKVTQGIKLSTLKADMKADNLDFQNAPLSKVYLIQTDANTYKLLWGCHHLLLDGWSSSIILKDVFSFYEALTDEKTANLPPVPSYTSYLKHLKHCDADAADLFWKTSFKDFKTPSLFKTPASEAMQLSTHDRFLDHDAVTKAKALAKTYQITSNTLFQGLWSLILSRYFNTTDVTYGTTVSGRSGNFQHMELMAGMFANVLPVRTLVDKALPLKNWFQAIQQQQLQARQFEHYTLSTISDSIAHTSGQLFDSLFIFENFPWETIKSASLKVHGFESGITTTYPITVTLKIEDTIHIQLRSDTSICNYDTANWLLEGFETLLDLLYDSPETPLEPLLNQLPEPQLPSKKVVKSQKDLSNLPRGAKNKIELELLKIWEDLLHIKSIGLQDHFFKIGGKSLLAIKMFTLIERRLQVKIPPITLLKHPTIETLAAYILKDAPSESWKFVVPIKSQGSKTPLFCIHGGGGFVFFFNAIANALDPDRPVYAIQPSGTHGGNEMHGSIEDMAKDYAKEIKAIQPEGPYNLLVYCFSPAVGIEIASILKADATQTHLIVVDSIIKQEDFASPDRIKMRIYGFANRLIKSPLSALKLMISNNYERFFEAKVIQLFASETKKNLEAIKRNLIRIYKAYTWSKKHPDDVLLILTEKADQNLNPIYISTWEAITDGKVTPVYTTGKHHQLFDAPYANAMANTIETYLVKNERSQA